MVETSSPKPTSKVADKPNPPCKHIFIYCLYNIFSTKVNASSDFFEFKSVYNKVLFVSVYIYR